MLGAPCQVQQLAVVTAGDEAGLNSMVESKEGDSFSQRFR